MKDIDPKEINKILLRLPNWIGDAVLAVPALRSIRTHFGSAEITFLAPESIIELLSGTGLSDKSIPLQRKKSTFFRKIDLIGRLKRERFDLAVLFQNAFEAAWIAFLAGIPRRFGYAKEGRGILLTHSPKIPKKSLHQMAYYLHLISHIEKMSPSWKPPALEVTPAEKDAAWNLLKKEGVAPTDFIVGFHAGAAYGSAKRWETLSFSGLGDRLIREKKVSLILFGSPEEDPVNHRIVEAMTTKPLNLSGKTTMRELVALISQCSLFISNDSGPMHIASALNVPGISIFGPTDSRTTSPAGLQHVIIQKTTECSPCLLRECPVDHRCMTSISVEEVIEVFNREWDKMRKPLRPAIFLDRDGTINEDTNYISREEDFHLFKETTEAMRSMMEFEMPIFIVTNQSGIARGFFTEEFLRTLHRKLEEIISAFQVRISGIYFCPHHPDAGCACRKPGTGMIREILRDHPIDLKNSYFIGDQLSDIDLANRIGAKPILVLTGKGNETMKKIESLTISIPVAHVARNILEAAKWIRQDLRNGENTTISGRNP